MANVRIILGACVGKKFPSCFLHGGVNEQSRCNQVTGTAVPLNSILSDWSVFMLHPYSRK